MAEAAAVVTLWSMNGLIKKCSGPAVIISKAERARARYIAASKSQSSKTFNFLSEVSAVLTAPRGERSHA